MAIRRFSFIRSILILPDFVGVCCPLREAAIIMFSSQLSWYFVDEGQVRQARFLFYFTVRGF